MRPWELYYRKSDSAALGLLILLGERDIRDCQHDGKFCHPRRRVIDEIPIFLCPGRPLRAKELAKLCDAIEKAKLRAELHPMSREIAH